MKYLPDFKLFMIDDYRKRFNPNCTMEGEFAACEAHDGDFEKEHYKIAEAGGSRWLIRQFLLCREQTLFIKVNCPLDLCRERVRIRSSCRAINRRRFPTTWKEQKKIFLFNCLRRISL